MTLFKCLMCNKDIAPEYLRKKVRCPYCGSKILFKPREVTKTIKAR